MSLTGRFSALFLSALGLVLVGFSMALYASAWYYLDRQVGDRLAAALAVLAAAAEIHPEGVEWEPQERVVALGQELGADRLRWLVFDEAGRRVDRSRNLVDAELTADWTPGSGGAALPRRLVDRAGRSWRVARRRLGPEAVSVAGESQAEPQPGEVFHPFLILTVCAPLDPMRTTLAALGSILVALSLAIWLVGAFLCRRLSRRALVPLTRMAASARGLDASDPGWSLEESETGDELDDLGRAFNDLLSRLNVAYERQRRFSADASHQLRTPLTVVIGQLQVALRRDRSGEEYRRVLATALGQAVQLAQIVEALLFLGRADADAHLPRGEPLELNRWVAEQLEGPGAAEPSGDVEHRRDETGPLWVRAHAPLLGQLLVNLLDNARKYGRPGSPILVETRREGAVAVLGVEDSGPGISAEDLPHVFEPFYRASRDRRRGLPGIGLGLSVVQRIATVSGGAVTVSSVKGTGARFEVRLPTTDPP